jgi:hypothetical protein
MKKSNSPESIDKFYKIANQVSFDSLRSVVEFVENNLDISAHHIAFAVPADFDESRFSQHCLKWIVHEPFNAILGYFLVDTVIVELIKPISRTSLLSKYCDSREYIFDHVCLHEYLGYHIEFITKIHTDLFDKKVSFIIDKFKNKIEIIHAANSNI